MKINAIEMLSLNKMNDKMGMNKSVSYMSDVPTTEQTGNTMNALQAQGMNNMAFHGGLLSKPVAKALIGLTLAAGALSLQSCHKNEPIVEKQDPKDIIITNINIVDFKAANAIYQQMIDLWTEMVALQKISNEQFVAMNNSMAELLQEVKDGNMTLAEFKQAVLQHFVVDEQNQETIIAQLKANGKTEEDIKALIEPFYEAYNKGDFETAWNYYLEIIKSINGHLENIDKTLSGLAINFNKFLADYNNHSANIEAKLDAMLANDNTKIAALMELNNNVANMRFDINGMKESSDSLYNLVAKNHEELMEVLKNGTGGGSDIRKEDLEQMLNALGITISQAINMSKDDLLDAIKNFQDTYIKTEENNTNVIGGKLDNINNELKKLFNEFVKFEGNYEKYNKAFLEKFDLSMDKLDGIIMAIEAFKAAQLNDNADILDAIKAMKAAQDVTNAYLLLLNEKGDQVIDIIEDIDGGGSGGITINQLKEYMGDEYFPTLEAMLKAFGLDDLPQEVTTIRQLLEQMNIKLDGINVAIKRLDTIIDQLNNLDFSDPVVQAKLDEIIELLKNLKLECNCQCNCGEDHHEGTDQPGDLDDLFG